MAKEALNIQQMRFCEAYVKNGGNGQQAAITAGYSEATATHQASRLLTKDHVTEYVDTLRQRLERKALVSLEMVVNGLKEIALEPNPDNNPKVTANKIRAWELLGKHVGAFAERVEHSGPDGLPIETRVIVEFADVLTTDETNATPN